MQYSPGKSFNKFIQSVVDVKKEEDENHQSGKVAETMSWVNPRMDVISCRNPDIQSQKHEWWKTFQAIKEPV